MQLKRQLTIFTLLILTSMIFFVSSCGTDASISYTTPFIPVIFAINTNGDISIQAGASIVTPLGTFAINGEGTASLQPKDDTLLLTIRHQHNDSIVDTVYRINTGKDEVT